MVLPGFSNFLVGLWKYPWAMGKYMQWPSDWISYPNRFAIPQSISTPNIIRSSRFRESTGLLPESIALSEFLLLGVDIIAGGHSQYNPTMRCATGNSPVCTGHDVTLVGEKIARASAM